MIQKRKYLEISSFVYFIGTLIQWFCVFPKSKRTPKKFLRLGTKESYSTAQAECPVTSECNNVELVTVKIRSSLRKIRCVLKKKEEESA